MNNKGSNIGVIIAIIAAIIMGLVSCSGGSGSSSSYQLHNKDGSINWEYYNDMQDYFAKHPDKRP